MTPDAEPAGPTQSLDRLRADVADVLGVPVADVDTAEPLPDQGLDSIRLMALVERWRASGARVTFAELAERPTLQLWARLFDTGAGDVG